jgi:hypothetical protein
MELGKLRQRLDRVSPSDASTRRLESTRGRFSAERSGGSPREHVAELACCCASDCADESMNAVVDDEIRHDTALLDVPTILRIPYRKPSRYHGLPGLTWLVKELTSPRFLRDAAGASSPSSLALHT